MRPLLQVSGLGGLHIHDIKCRGGKVHLKTTVRVEHVHQNHPVFSAGFCCHLLPLVLHYNTSA